MLVKAYFGIIIGLLLMVGGVIIGRYSVNNEVPLLPTIIPATPINYLEQVEADPEPYGFADGTPTPLPTFTGELAEAQVLYDTYCAHCHGYTGGGEPHEPNPNIPNALGFMPVPRHDSQGHTWLHPDQILIDIIKVGSESPLFGFPMPAFEALLTDEEIIMIIDYMKLWWTEEQREQQAAYTERLTIARENR